MKVLVTGAKGFIGQNIVSRFGVEDNIEVIQYMRESTIDELRIALTEVDFICHMAGVNRSKDENEFTKVNTDFTSKLCKEIQHTGRHIPILFASSVYVERDNLYGKSKHNLYGKSKLDAEEVLLQYSNETGSLVYIFRLPHVVGKWCRPNYNSVVATFCYNIARNLPIKIDDPDYQLNLVYIDDLIDLILQIISGERSFGPYCEVSPSYPITVGNLATQLQAFKDSRSTLITERVGKGLLRILYATYTSYLPLKDFSYNIEKHSDNRGLFAEVLKTKDSGQVSFFTAHPGITRGGHYHHSKTEKFLVIKGEAKFQFRNIMTNELHQILTSAENLQIVETIPGWAHDITNVGDDEMVVMLWANEIFDLQHPDTYTSHL